MPFQKKSVHPIIVLNQMIIQAGRHLKGKVLLTTHGRWLKPSSRVSIYGEEEVGGGSTTKTKRFFSQELMVWDKRCGTQKMLPDELHSSRPAAHHCFSFSFPLPDNLPPSFVGKKGSIRYGVEVGLDWYREPAQIERKDFFVTQKSSLVRNKRENPEKKIVLGQGDLVMKTTLSDTILFPRQSIVICAQLRNESEETVRKIKFKLIRHTEYAYPEHSSDEKTIIDSGIIDFKVKRMETSDFSYTMDIPTSIHPSFVSSMIHVSYKLQIKVFTDKVILHHPIIFSMVVTVNDGEAIYVDPLAQLEELTNFGFIREDEK